MEDPTQPSVDRLTTLLAGEEYDEAIASLERVATADADVRKAVLRTLKETAADRPARVSPVLETLSTFLEDDERSIRLTTAKLFVTVARSEPGETTPTVPVLTERLADEEEFYYVRARCAEAIGYVALEHPEVVSPELLAELRVGLAFEEPEVREKLAKALSYVALGDPNRLTQHVPTLAEHLDDENELVRYHLTTTLVVIGSERPLALEEARDTLRERMDDEEAYVRGRAAEALGLLARAADDGSAIPVDALRDLADDESSFVAKRARFAGSASASTRDEKWNESDERVGSIDAIRERTDEIVEDIATPDTAGECPHCGLTLPEDGHSMCPRCGVPV